MIPLVGVPKSIAKSLQKYRQLFKREKAFETVSRFITGLILSPNKTLEAIHSQQVWEEGKEIKRRAMHHAVFEAPWNSEEIMPQHREIIASDHRGKGQEVISLDWTLSHHEKGEKIYGVKKLYDYVEGKMSRYQTVVTATIANQEIIDGIEVVVQEPNYEKEELDYLKMTYQESYEQMEQVRERLSELFYYQKNRLAYRKRTEIAVDIVKEIEKEGQFPEANYAFDNGVLTLALTEVIEQSGKHWVSEIEKNRNINWKGSWTRVDVIAEELKKTSPSSFRQFAKQITGLESSQVRNSEAVKRHFRLSCVAQSLLQRVACAGQKSKNFSFEGKANYWSTSLFFEP